MAANTEPLLRLLKESTMCILHFVVKLKCQSLFAKKNYWQFCVDDPKHNSTFPAEKNLPTFDNLTMGLLVEVKTKTQQNITHNC